MATIYELTEAYRQLLELAEDQYTDQAVLADTMEAQEEDRLADRRKAIEKNARSIKERLERSMIAMNKKKIKTDLFSFNIQKNPPSLVIDKMDDVPEVFLISQPDKVNNGAIMMALKSGAKYNWCHLAQSESLRIR